MTGTNLICAGPSDLAIYLNSWTQAYVLRTPTWARGHAGPPEKACSYPVPILLFFLESVGPNGLSGFYLSLCCSYPVSLAWDCVLQSARGFVVIDDYPFAASKHHLAFIR